MVGCGEAKISHAPSAACRPVHKALVKRESRSEATTSESGSHRSRDTDATKLRAAVSAVAVQRSEPATRARPKGRFARPVTWGSAGGGAGQPVAGGRR